MQQSSTLGPSRPGHLPGGEVPSRCLAPPAPAGLMGRSPHGTQAVAPRPYHKLLAYIAVGPTLSVNPSGNHAHFVPITNPCTVHMCPSVWRLSTLCCFLPRVGVPFVFFFRRTRSFVEKRLQHTACPFGRAEGPPLTDGVRRPRPPGSSSSCAGTPRQSTRPRPSARGVSRFPP